MMEKNVEHDEESCQKNFVGKSFTGSIKVKAALNLKRMISSMMKEMINMHKTHVRAEAAEKHQEKLAFMRLQEFDICTL